ncbi:uncharacterized protein LAJ45_01436 [Morchella importuna]|uniref:uncharacterized protein n=1 Tax=Morchella importuna TaxID=1174673 RepID=UPI001E8EE7A6|nr:uncharacterized protein LAJ45_01436 [Morchella importuna]KAH8154904.1 hypothetical protein LAJ45_01436 [Morchella importuna]
MYPSASLCWFDPRSLLPSQHGRVHGEQCQEEAGKVTILGQYVTRSEPWTHRYHVSCPKQYTGRVRIISNSLTNGVHAGVLNIRIYIKHYKLERIASENKTRALEDNEIESRVQGAPVAYYRHVACDVLGSSAWQSALGTSCTAKQELWLRLAHPTLHEHNHLRTLLYYKSRVHIARRERKSSRLYPSKSYSRVELAVSRSYEGKRV